MVHGNGTNPVGGEGVPEGLLASPTSRPHGRHAAEDLTTKVRELPEMINEANTAFVGFVREQPLVALGAALGIGYVLGRMLRRVV